MTATRKPWKRSSCRQRERRQDEDQRDHSQREGPRFTTPGCRTAGGETNRDDAENFICGLNLSKAAENTRARHCRPRELEVKRSGHQKYEEFEVIHETTRAIIGSPCGQRRRSFLLPGYGAWPSQSSTVIVLTLLCSARFNYRCRPSKVSNDSFIVRKPRSESAFRPRRTRRSKWGDEHMCTTDGFSSSMKSLS